MHTDASDEIDHTSIKYLFVILDSDGLLLVGLVDGFAALCLPPQTRMLIRLETLALPEHLKKY